MNTEIWKDIPGYEGSYQASSYGRIKSLSRKVRGINHYTGSEFSRMIAERILRPGRFCKAGHVSVVLGRGSMGIPVHHLIMRTFVGECSGGLEILHINGDPTDNRLENLRYGTRTENILDVYRQGGRWRKLSVNDVREIRNRLDDGEKGHSIAQHFGVSDTTISSIKTGRCFGWLKSAASPVI